MVKNPVPLERGQKPSPSEKRSKTQSLFLFKNPVPQKAWFKNPVPAENTVKNPVAQKPSRSKTQSLKNPVAQEPEIPPCKKSKTQSLDWDGSKTQSLAFVACPKTQSLKNPVPHGLGFWTVPIEGLGFWRILIQNRTVFSEKPSAPHTLPNRDGGN